MKNFESPCLFLDPPRGELPFTAGRGGRNRLGLGGNSGFAASGPCHGVLGSRVSLLLCFCREFWRSPRAMITLKKLATLSEGTRLRKIASLLRGITSDISLHSPRGAFSFSRGWGVILRSPCYFPPPLRKDGALLASGELSSDPDALLRFCDGIYYRLSEFLGISPGDWDLREPKTGEYKKEDRSPLPLRVYLEDMRSPFNVGSIIRTAECFGAERVFLSPGTPTPDHPRVRRTGHGGWRYSPLGDTPP